MTRPAPHLTVGQASVPDTERRGVVDESVRLRGRHGGLPHSGTGAIVVVCAMACLSTSTTACLFLPNIGPDGYVACTSSSDCDPGRSCGEGICAPPPWNDEKFEARRVLVVKNPSTTKIAKGTTIPVTVGGSGAILSLKDVAADFRVTDFDDASHTWHDVSVAVDRLEDRFTLWIPLQRDVAPGKSEVLAYLEQETGEPKPNVVENAASAFGTAYDGFDDDTLDDTKWKVHGAPTIQNGAVNVGDGQAIAMKLPIKPPLEATFIARLNGVTCDRVFIGLNGDVDNLFAVGPEAGVFVKQDLAANAFLAADAAQTPTDFGDAITAKTVFQHVVVDVDKGFVQVKDDGDVAYDDENLHPAFGDAPMFLAVQVAGACSVDVDAVWAVALPHPAPVVTPGDLIKFQLFN